MYKIRFQVKKEVNDDNFVVLAKDAELPFKPEKDDVFELDGELIPLIPAYNLGKFNQDCEIFYDINNLRFVMEFFDIVNDEDIDEERVTSVIKSAIENFKRNGWKIIEGKLHGKALKKET